MKIILLLLLSLVVVFPVDAALELNELYPSPDKSSFEWLELVNSGSQQLSTNGYLIRDAANNTIPLPTHQLEPGHFLIATASSLLNNSGDTVYLISSTGEIIDIATYSATLNSTQSFARCPGNRWVVTTAISKEQPNLDACIQPTTSPSPPITPVTTVLPTLFPVTPSPTVSPAIGEGTPVVSEVMSSPQSGENEWIELYNPYSFALSLAEFQIDDGEGGSRPRFLSGTIPPKSYYVVTLQSGIFNNDGDQVRLLSRNNTPIDSFSYEDGKKGITWGRQQLTTDSPVCMMEPSPGNINTTCLNNTSSKSDSETEDYIGSNTESDPGTGLRAGQTSLSSTVPRSLASGTSSNRTPFITEEYTAAFSNPDTRYPDLPVSVQLRSPHKPDTRSTTVALTVSLTGSLFSFISILLKINRVYLPL